MARPEKETAGHREEGRVERMGKGGEGKEWGEEKRGDGIEEKGTEEKRREE